MTSVIVLQARMTSSRLPGKVLVPLDGQPLIVHCVRRLLAASAGPVVVAAPEAARNDGLCQVAARAGAAIVRGSEDDVLGRMWTAAREWNASAIVRATADNPAVDPCSVARVLEALAEGADYAVDVGLPVGATVEGIRRETLRCAYEEAPDGYDREHVTPFVQRHAGRFRVCRLPAPVSQRRTDLRFTVDTLADVTDMNELLTEASGADRIVPLTELIVTADRLLASKRCGRVDVA